MSYQDIYWQEALPVWRKILGIGGVVLIFLVQILLIIPAYIELRLVTQPATYVHHEHVNSGCDCDPVSEKMVVLEEKKFI